MVQMLIECPLTHWLKEIRQEAQGDQSYQRERRIERKKPEKNPSFCAEIQPVSGCPLHHVLNGIKGKQLTAVVEGTDLSAKLPVCTSSLT